MEIDACAQWAGRMGFGQRRAIVFEHSTVPKREAQSPVKSIAASLLSIHNGTIEEEEHFSEFSVSLMAVMCCTQRKILQFFTFIRIKLSTSFENKIEYSGKMCVYTIEGGLIFFCESVFASSRIHDEKFFKPW